MAIEAPYKGRDNTPAPADKVVEEPADKPDPAGRDEAMNLTATRHDAPREGSNADDVKPEDVVEETEEEASTEVPDADLILMRADYSKKTAALAAKQREIEARMADNENRYSVYAQVDAMLAANPELSRTHTVEQLVALIQSPNAPTQMVREGLPAEVRKEIEEFRAERRELKETSFLETVQSEMGRIKADYGLTDKEVQKVVEIAVQAEEIDYTTPRQKVHFKLDLIANKLASANAVRNGQRKVVQQLKDKGRAASAGAPSTQTADAGPRVKGWDNLVAKFQAEAKAKRRD